MNKLSLASLAAVAACSGAPIIQQSAPEIGDTQGSTQRQALVALGEHHTGWQNNGDFIYCTDDTTHTGTENLVKKGLMPAGEATSSLLEDETKHLALLKGGLDACSMEAEDKGKELGGVQCIDDRSGIEFQEKKSPKPSTFSIPIYCDGDDKPTHMCSASMMIKDIGRNDTGDDVCVRVGIEGIELIPTSQTPPPEAPELD